MGNKISPVFGPQGAICFDALRSEADYEAALARIVHFYEAEPGCPEYDELTVLTMLIDAWEAGR